MNSLQGKKVAQSRHSINSVIFAHSLLTHDHSLEQSLEWQSIHICSVRDLTTLLCQSAILPRARCFSFGPSKSFATRTQAAWECHQENNLDHVNAANFKYKYIVTLKGLLLI